MIEEENKRYIECGDDRFEIIARARKHIIEATNIEMSPKEMEVLDNFLFRCWQMGWLKNDFHQLENENEELKEKYESNKNPIEKILELRSQIVKLNEYARSICKNYTGEKNYNCKHHWDCSDCINWEMK